MKIVGIGKLCTEKICPSCRNSLDVDEKGYCRNCGHVIIGEEKYTIGIEFEGRDYAPDPDQLNYIGNVTWAQCHKCAKVFRPYSIRRDVVFLGDNFWNGSWFVVRSWNPTSHFWSPYCDECRPVEYEKTMDFYEESQRKQAKRDAEKQQKRLAEKEKREAEKRQRREQALAFFAQAQEEERKQKRKWFGKKFKPAINLYEKAARLGHTEAQRKANELKK